MKNKIQTLGVYMSTINDRLVRNPFFFGNMQIEYLYVHCVYKKQLHSSTCNTSLAKLELEIQSRCGQFQFIYTQQRMPGYHSNLLRLILKKCHIRNFDILRFLLNKLSFSSLTSNILAKYILQPYLVKN